MIQTQEAVAAANQDLIDGMYRAQSGEGGAGTGGGIDRDLAEAVPGRERRMAEVSERKRARRRPQTRLEPGRRSSGSSRWWCWPAIGVGGYTVWQRLSLEESTDDAQIDGTIVPISARITGNVVAVEAKDERQ